MKHLVTLDELELQPIFKLADKIKLDPTHYQDALKNKIITNLFYEPSTRTSSSFASAMYKLGGQVISINDVNYSSISKGENLEDTIITMSNYCDLIVLRSKQAGDAQVASELNKVPIINAGDGTGEHPTQTLLDLYTIYKNIGRLDNLIITFVGDIENGRTVHSLDKALSSVNNEKHFINTFDHNAWPASDVYYLTRVQTERGSIGKYSMNRHHVINMPNECIVMHPFPRNEEIPRWFDTDPRAKYFEQMENGLYIRMALLLVMLKKYQETSYDFSKTISF
jgi:aspartate carbamoyltransferase catalytic subunit